jgi:indolepyruvate ferredoxin oxidoreductase alpha subunit
MEEILTGNEAIARGAYEAGVSVATGYPGTPSTEVLENLVNYPGVYTEWAPNEKVALEVAFGASMGGARALVTMKHVGLNVAADPFMTLSYTGVNGGLVILTADDPGMFSSQNEQDNRYYARFAQVPLVEPSDSQEASEFLQEAYRISEKYDTPVLFRTTTRVAHTSSVVELHERQEVVQREFQRNIPKYVMLPAHARGRHIVVEKRLASLKEYAEQTDLNKIIWGGRSIGVIASGVAYQYTREAMGDSVSYLKLGFTYPLPLKLVAQFASQVEKLVVVEELEPFIEEQLRAAGFTVNGKDIFSVQGELNPDLVRSALQGTQTEGAGTTMAIPDLPVRPPIMCPGCPHRAVFYTLHRLGAIVTGDIGCYTLGAAAPFNAIDSCLCMGASIGAGFGLARALPEDQARRVVSVIGDSTFIHSGITGLIEQIYNLGRGTVIILDNRTTAMTGHQDNPATGVTLQKKQAPRLDFVKLINALGITDVTTVDPYDLQSLEETIKNGMAKDSLSVIIANRPCVFVAGKHDKREIPEVDCQGCKKCLQLACPSLILKDKSVTRDEATCQTCLMCTQVCPQVKRKVGRDVE